MYPPDALRVGRCDRCARLRNGFSARLQAMNAKLQQPGEATLLGLVLTGGGARAAYQVGVLKGIAEQLGRGAGSPFQVITGTSAGAVSAIALASDAAHFRHAVYAIEKVWRDFRVHHVIKADAVSVLRSGLQWILALTTGGWLVHPPRSVFDNTPLVGAVAQEPATSTGFRAGMYKQHLQRRRHLRDQLLGCGFGDLLCLLRPIEPWTRAARKGARVQLTLEHLMASLSIPFLFRPIFLHQQYFGDGAMRQTSPLSPAIHLGRTACWSSSAWAIPRQRASACRPSGPSRPSARCSASCSIRCSWISCSRISSGIEALQRRHQGAAYRLPGAHAVAGSLRDRAPPPLGAAAEPAGAASRDGGELLQAVGGHAVELSACSSAATPAS